MDVSFRTGDSDGHCHIAGTNWLHRSDFGKLNFLLGFGHLNSRRCHL